MGSRPLREPKPSSRVSLPVWDLESGDQAAAGKQEESEAGRVLGCAGGRNGLIAADFESGDAYVRREWTRSALEERRRG